MDTNFDKELIEEINRFRANPKIIKINLEKELKNFSLKKQNETVLKEIKAFLENLDDVQCYPKLENNKILKEIAKIELLKYKKREANQKYINNNEIKKLFPNYFSNYEILAIKAKKISNIVTDILIEKPEKFKIRKNILCNSKFNQIGIAKELHTKENKENFYIFIFATKIIYEPKIIKKENLYKLKKPKINDIIKKSSNVKY